MAIEFGSVGSVVEATTSNVLEVPFPASINSGDLLVIVVGLSDGRSGNSVFPAVDGWTKPSGGESSGGQGGQAPNSGTAQVGVYYKVATGAESGTVSIDVSGTSNAVQQAVMLRYTKTATSWEVSATNGGDNSAGTDWSVTGAGDPGITAGDMVLVGSAWQSNIPRASSQAVSASGISAWGTVEERVESTTTSADNGGFCVSEHPVVTGTSSAAPVFTQTMSAVGPNHPAGASVILRLREVSGGPEVYTLTAEAGSVSITGTNADLLKTNLLASSPGSFAITGQNANLTKQSFLDCEGGSFVVTGQDLELLKQSILTCFPGAYSLTGINASLLSHRLLNGSPGSFVITGIDADLTTVGSYELVCESGTYAITGINADLLSHRLLGCSPGSFAITGIDLDLLRHLFLDCSPGEFVITGVDADFVTVGAYDLICNPGSFAITGVNANLIFFSPGLVLRGYSGIKMPTLSHGTKVPTLKHGVRL